MLQDHRKTHFYTIIFLICSLPIVFLFGLLWRPKVSIVDERTDRLFSQANFFSAGEGYKVIASENLTVNDIPILTELVSSSQGIKYLSFQPNQTLQLSDVLVYLTAEESEIVNQDDILLGQLSGIHRRYFPISQQSPKDSTYLLFYSLGQDKAIASIPLPASLSLLDR